MPSFHTALDALADLSVSGVKHNYRIDQTPEQLARGGLPVLLVLPVERRSSLFDEGGEAFESIAFAQGGQTVTYTVTHLLIVAPDAGSGTLSAQLPTLIDIVDGYFTALSADLTLNGALLEPPQIRVETGIFDYGGVEYVGCAFRHTWQMEVMSA